MTTAKRKLILVGCHTFCFSGTISSALWWGEFHWMKIASVAITGVLWGMAFGDVLKCVTKKA